MKTSSNLAHAANADRLATIWAIVEARQAFPALIVVASATASDDTEPVARGLSGVAQEAGKRTGYVYLGREARPHSSAAVAYAALTLAGRESQRESFDSSLSVWRASYDVVIVELAQLASCALGAHAARLADGIVVALHADRKVVKADRELTTLFRQLGASVIGIVKTPATPARVDSDRSKSWSLTSFLFPARQQ